MTLPARFFSCALAALLTACASSAPIEDRQKSYGSFSTAKDTELTGQAYTREEVIAVACDFFGGTSEGLAKAIERVFSDYGRPSAYILGEEGSGAIIVGLRYGQGTLRYKGGGEMPVYWQGPSVGWDFGGNAAKVFPLVYNLRFTDRLFQRFPAGAGLNYQRSGDVILAPIRTGVGLRAGASLGYVHYTPEPSIIPF